MLLIFSRPNSPGSASETKNKTQDVSTPVSRAGENAREPSSAQHDKFLIWNASVWNASVWNASVWNASVWNASVWNASVGMHQ
ncbi:MAG: hypothetical protein DMG60_21975 [Acidobacteria bacterium]|nr:MAG: hypothetical protein DMG60_21975 [Acidobacteriota bacterium]